MVQEVKYGGGPGLTQIAHDIGAQVRYLGISFTGAVLVATS
jgi:hypothetical protein